MKARSITRLACLMALPIAISVPLSAAARLADPVNSTSPTGSSSARLAQGQVKTPDYDRLRSQLDAKRKLWQSKGLRNYEFVFSYAGHMQVAPTLRVQVIKSRARSAEVVDTGIVGRVPAEIVKQYGTIDKLFDMIEQACKYHFSHIDVVYDPQYAYPTTIDLVSTYEVTESDQRIVVSAFKALK